MFRPLKIVVLAQLVALRITSALLVNRTIDDAYGDEITGTGVVYNVDLAWNNSWTALTGASEGSVSTLKFDATQMFMGTWHDGEVALGSTQSNGMNISVSFTGVAVYAMFALPPAEPSAGVKHYTDLQFSLDGSLVQGGEFTYFSNHTQYNVPVFSKEGLENGLHHLVIFPGSRFSPQDQFTYNLFEFDYVIYTQDTEANSKEAKSETFKIVAEALGVVVAVLSLSTVYLLWSKHRTILCFQRLRPQDETTVQPFPWVSRQPPAVTARNPSDFTELPNSPTALLARMRRDLQSYEKATTQLLHAAPPVIGPQGIRRATMLSSGGPELLNEFALLQRQMRDLALRVETLDQAAPPPEYPRVTVLSS